VGGKRESLRKYSVRTKFAERTSFAASDLRYALLTLGPIDCD
jgi:hypothetical protein